MSFYASVPAEQVTHVVIWVVDVLNVNKKKMLNKDDYCVKTEWVVVAGSTFSCVYFVTISATLQPGTITRFAQSPSLKPNPRVCSGAT